MVIFNQTFSAERPIYFPDNWASGRTQMELYAEWKQGLEGIIYSNVLQVGAASMFIMLMVVIFSAAKELYRYHCI
jgi:hypothetical protein